MLQNFGKKLECALAAGLAGVLRHYLSFLKQGTGRPKLLPLRTGLQSLIHAAMTSIFAFC